MKPFLAGCLFGLLVLTVGFFSYKIGYKKAIDNLYKGNPTFTRMQDGKKQCSYGVNGSTGEVIWEDCDVPGNHAVSGGYKLIEVKK